MSTLQNHVRWCIRAQAGLTALMFALLCGFYLFGYRPLTAHLQQLRAQIAQGQYELRDGQARTRVLPVVAVEVKTLREQLDQSKKLPSQQELPQFLKELTAIGQEASLKRFVIKPGTAVRQPLFKEMPISLSFEGDFIDVSSFLRHTEQMQRLARIRLMSIKSVDGKLGQVQVQLSMNLYFAPEEGVPEAKLTNWADAR